MSNGVEQANPAVERGVGFIFMTHICKWTEQGASLLVKKQNTIAHTSAGILKTKSDLLISASD